MPPKSICATVISSTGLQWNWRMPGWCWWVISTAGRLRPNRRDVGPDRSGGVRPCLRDRDQQISRDRALFDEGVRFLTARTGIPILGMLPRTFAISHWTRRTVLT